ncbi:MAG: FAD-binding protein [Planctomycetota bacterium]|nr:MAG: FAD-binding protein [Planctomycetota bacterium]
MLQVEEVAFPQLTAAELEVVKVIAARCEYEEGEVVFRAGQPKIDLFVVESGGLEIQNPTAGGAVIVTHGPGEFSGDIDLLTGRPVIVTGVARGPTRLLRVSNDQVRVLLSRIPSLSEKMIAAFTRRRELLSSIGSLGLRVVGPGRCRATSTVREFLYKNFVPFTWFDSASEDGRQALAEMGSPAKAPVVECGSGRVLINPPLQELAREAGVWEHCPSQEVDFAIVGAGPAGIAAAVYAASEGLSTVILDQLGPGGQAGSSSRIENFIGFPAGLSGTDLATRGVLQMLKFGARMIAPVRVENLLPGSETDAWHTLDLDCGAQIRCRVLLLALGVRWRQLDAPGAERFLGAGIHYSCTMVEADLYDQADVAVVGGGNSAGQAVMFLAECCPTRTVHLLIRRTLETGMSSYLAQRIRAAGNVVIHEHTEIEALRGDWHVETIDIANKVTQATSQLPCAAVFVFIGAEPAAEWLPAAMGRDRAGYLLTGTEVVRSGQWPRADRDPCPLETTIPGILAAGDIRSGSTKRVGFAVGDGSLAVTCLHQLLSIRR